MAWDPNRRSNHGTCVKNAPPTFNWDWNYAVIALTEEDTHAKLGSKTVKSLTCFTKNPVAAMTNPDVYGFRSVLTLDPNPLYRHSVGIGASKTLYYLYKHYDKKELMDDEHIMKGHFGEIKSGIFFWKLWIMMSRKTSWSESMH